MLLCSGKNGLWAFSQDGCVSQVVARAGACAGLFGLTRTRPPWKVDELPAEAGLTLEFNEHKVEAEYRLLENGQPLAPLMFSAREYASGLLVGSQVFVLGDTENEVFDIETKTSRALPARDVGSDVMLAVCGNLLVVAAPEGQVNILELGTLQWANAVPLNLDMPPGHRLQALVAHDGLAYLKLPLSLVTLNLSSLEVTTCPAPWVHEPQLVWDTLGPGLELQPLELPLVNLVPSHIYDADAFLGYKDTGRTDDPASVASDCIARGNSDLLSQLLTQHDFDACLTSCQQLPNGRLSFSPLHSLLPSDVPRTLVRVVLLHAEIRDAPLVYLPPAYGHFKFLLDDLPGFRARELTREILACVFVNLDELI
jgi:hypothetical protein